MQYPVRIATGCRLHCGPLAVGAVSGRAFGGIGWMLEAPGVDLRAELAVSDRYAGPPEHAAGVAAALAAVRAAGHWSSATGLSLTLCAAIPRHLGLGSGTQLALAVAQAVCGAAVLPATRLAAGRGARSAIGIHGFEHGGFIVDAGKLPQQSIGTLAARCVFPSDWPVLLWSPPDGRGLSGDAERLAFSQLPAMPTSLTDRLAAIALRELLPALADHDWESFSRGLRSYGDLVGEFFAPAQGGVWADPRAAQVVGWLRDCGIAGVAQSSWGPTIAAVLPDAAAAQDIARRWPFAAETLRLTRARNRGADVTLATADNLVSSESA